MNALSTRASGLLLVGLAGAVISLAATTTRLPAVRLLPPPAAAGSGMYGLTTSSDGTPYLSWLEPTGEGIHALKFSRLDKGVWADAREIARSDNWFVNWADHPTLAVLPNGSLVAHWLANNGDKRGSYGYGFRIALSSDGGHRWHEVHAGGTDNTEGYSGFVSILPTASGFEAIYLGPPKPHDPKPDPNHVMTLAALRFSLGGRLEGETVVDADTCSCCSTSIVQTGQGPIAAYRDRAAGEIRDISVVRLRNGKWAEPTTVHDGWQINACPTNGPALAASGSRVAMAWFTGAGGVPRVKVAWSQDAGETFSAPVIIDGGRPVGWPATVMLDDGSAVVSWLESRGDGHGELRLRRISSSGRAGDPITVAESSSGRSTGMPQMVRMGNDLLLAWRTDRVQTALVPVPAY
ncbi:MAG: sialidase family protein [Vicinamibacterales bacterium]